MIAKAAVLLLCCWLSIRGSGAVTSSGGAVTSYNCFVTSIAVDEWTAEGGGTDVEILGRETIDPSAPATSKLVKSAATSGKLVRGKFTIPAGLKTAMEAGGTITSFVVHFYGKSAVTEGLQFKWGGIVAVKTPTGTTTKWDTATAGSPGAITLANLEANSWEIETLKAKAGSAYEIYCVIEVEAAGSSSAPSWLTRAGRTLSRAMGRGR